MRLSRFSDVFLRHVGIFGWEYRFVFVATVLSCRFYNTFYLSYFSIYPTVKMFFWKITIVKGQVKISIRHVNREKLLWAFCCYGTVEYRSFWLAVFSMMWYMVCKFTANADLSVHIITWYPNAACFGGNHTVMCIVSRCWASAFCKEKPWHSGGKANGTAYSNGKFCGEKSAICRKVEQYHFPGHHAQTFKQNNAFACVLHFCTFLCRPFQTIKWRGKFKVS